MTKPLFSDAEVRKMVRAWANYNETSIVKVYNLVFDHGGVCIANALVRIYDPRLRTNIDIWFKSKAPIFDTEREYTIDELCGKEEE